MKKLTLILFLAIFFSCMGQGGSSDKHAKDFKNFFGECCTVSKEESNDFILVSKADNGTKLETNYSTNWTLEDKHSGKLVSEQPLVKYAISKKFGNKFIIWKDYSSEKTELFEKLQYAIYEGKTYRIKFAGIIKQNTESAGQSYRDFDNLSGAVFDNLDGHILPLYSKFGIETTILLVNQEFLDENKLIPFTKDEYSENTYERVVETLKKQYKRKVINTNIIASFNGNVFAVAQFENKGNQALGVYMFQSADGKCSLADFPATIEKSDDDAAISVWRIEDDGIFASPSIDEIFKEGDNYKFFVVEFNSESTISYFITMKGDKLLIDDKSQMVRYTPPSEY